MPDKQIRLPDDILQFPFNLTATIVDGACDVLCSLRSGKRTVFFTQLFIASLVSTDSRLLVAQPSCHLINSAQYILACTQLFVSCLNDGTH